MSRRFHWRQRSTEPLRLAWRFGTAALLAAATAACAQSPVPPSATPRSLVAGSLLLSGSVNATLSVATASCQWGAGRVDGDVSFAGSLHADLRFSGNAGTSTLPLSAHSASLVLLTTDAGRWSAGQDSPASSGVLVLSAPPVHGSIDAALQPQGGAGAVHATGSWSC